MKSNLIIIFGLIFVIILYMSGAIVSKYAHIDPTPEQCLSICAEEFEKMAG